jgi:plasmid stabilization system protein ParE
MALKIKWNKRADDTFEKIIIYLEDEFGFSVAQKFALHVFKTVELLAEFPELGSPIQKNKLIRGFVLLKQVSIFYRYDKKQLIILNLFDNRRKPKK